MIRNLVKRVVAHPSKGSAHLPGSSAHGMSAASPAILQYLQATKFRNHWGLTQTSIDMEYRHFLRVQYRHRIEIINTHVYCHLLYTLPTINHISFSNDTLGSALVNMSHGCSDPSILHSFTAGLSPDDTSNPVLVSICFAL